MRSFERESDQLRPIELIHDFQLQADASLLFKMGNTHVLCSATIEDEVPPFLRDSGQGWITAEYGMLPCSTDSRMRRESTARSGRTLEIQRLIGRSLRMMLDLSHLGERTIRIDCDVINADGGTRTASISGAALVVRNALQKAVAAGRIPSLPTILPVGAVSVGIVAGEALLDLDYAEDSQAQVDANFVMSGDGRLIEIQSTAEGSPFSREQFNRLAELAEKGIMEILQLWGTSA